MPQQPRYLANEYEDIVNLQGAGAYCGDLPHSLLNIEQYIPVIVTKNTSNINHAIIM